MVWVTELEAEPGLEPRSPDSRPGLYSILYPLVISQSDQGPRHLGSHPWAVCFTGEY